MRRICASDKCNPPPTARRSQITASRCVLDFIGLKRNKTQLQLHQLQITGSHFAGIIIYLRGVSREPRMKSRPRDERRACTV